MYKKTITGHMIVKNEEKWIWYSIMSIIDFVDKLIIYDTGSQDKTIELVKRILSDAKFGKKIIFEERGQVSSEKFTLLRQEQLEKTNTDYFFVVDGDEIWYKKSLEEIKYIINNSVDDVHLIASKFLNCAGDIFHYRDFSKETYRIKNIVGSITIRLYSMKIKGLHCAGDYGVEGYYDYLKKPVQESEWNIHVIEKPYLHTSYLQRAGFIEGDLSIKYRKNKFRADWDHSFDKNFKYPEVFYLEPPDILESPWENKIGIQEKFMHLIRKIKKILMGR